MSETVPTHPNASATQQVTPSSTDPQAWSVKDGAKWLTTKGFPEDVIHKFTGKTALLYYILVICLIQAQPSVFQDKYGGVYTIKDELRTQMRIEVRVPGADVMETVTTVNLIPVSLGPTTFESYQHPFRGLQRSGAGSLKMSRMVSPHLLSVRGSGKSFQSHRYSYRNLTSLYADFGKLPKFVVLPLGQSLTR
ncbi:hypothetical protein M413DRAFT_32853 [Hebeloma cylindrosporum]|uniref:Uncharacterized protein n=1 Tax=Hebeloma cylindrosporum TaxID=76867 RepID=A0A0C2Y1N5_HEBCY|nr:hypothetical protein M413DRAFT_32853 [Hebeloma cylindrosporum h7]